ncbi:DUF1659 domain-containing protein [Desulfitobacterium metallireducens]|uniref:DUF1659 domain-containing protein n=1 Tax=Desulfitobacterium metallireducens DSM 15288 TaxID=871968 RepID=W0EDK1_9FIRM|nr:DUF1659 domain-containing protein [Desulfitobacterium metallireducens]AHF07259.1 hypothetical protein DESME_09625 [Desulfitobacterium metallireducens DSM 15288]
MAVSKTPVTSSIRLSLVTGLDTQGAPILKQTNLSNVKSNALDQDLFDVANALVGLQEYSVHKIQRLDTAELIEMV